MCSKISKSSVPLSSSPSLRLRTEEMERKVKEEKAAAEMRSAREVVWAKLDSLREEKGRPPPTLGVGVEQPQPRERSAIPDKSLADCVEALIGCFLRYK